MILSIFCCPAQCFRGGVRGGHDSVHVRVTFFARGNNNMSLFFWVHVLLGEVCAVSWGRAYVLC